ncbi:DUF547 domain-containing protein [Alteromonas sp. CYL-A6]|uniref:DUF547 domain-containing protein n=1 Tax=Alteromonas nitratireducens TaxID=3390813 RepID=UPI0034B7F377
MKKLLFIVSLSIPLFALASQDKPDGDLGQFMQANQNSELTIAYDDLDAFLDSAVYNVGHSTREKASASNGITGTYMRERANRLTALEGNRIFFQAFENDAYAEVLTTLQKSLETLPDAAPLSSFNKNEQLAYWLNLYNFTMINTLVKALPYPDIGRMLADENDPLMDRKLLTVSGVPLSLNDIKFRILKEKYDANPLILYGLFHGVIGGPSIQVKAFRGYKVWRQLEQSAIEFIHSNRGSYYGGRLSAWYADNLAFFNNDKAVLKAHVLDYLSDDIRDDIASTPADALKLDIHDHNLADIAGGRQFGAGLANNRAALIDAGRSSQQGVGMTQSFIGDTLLSSAKFNVRFSDHEIEMLQKMKDKNAVSRGRVTITDMLLQELEEDASSSDNQP